MIYVKLVVVCETGGCETTEEYLVELSNFETEEGLYLGTLPEDWGRVNDVPRDRGLAARVICPKCVKERR